MKKIIALQLALILIFSTALTCKEEINTGAKHDWIVSVDPSKTKDQNEFDVIVVGSGIGGLSCASILAKKGYKVLVVEQHSQVGGFCSSYMQDGFSCSVGVEDVSGINEMGGIGILLKMLDLKAEDLFVLNTRTYLIGNKKIILTGGKDDFIQQVSKHYPQEKQSLKSFLDEGQKAYEEYSTSKERTSITCPTFFKWHSVTYQQKLDEFFENSELKNLFCSLLPYIDSKADKIPASIALCGCVQYFIYGGYYPKGGPQHFSETLRDVIEQHGGIVLTDCKVKEILVNNDQVSGISTGNRTFFAPVVVANANAKTTFSGLVPEGAIDENFVDAVKNLKMSFSIIQVTLGVDMDLSHLTSMVHMLDKNNKCSFVIPSNSDTIAAPNGKATINLYVKSKYEEIPQPGTIEYKNYKEEKVQEKINKIKKIIPELSKHIVVKEILTPRSFKQFTSMPKGAIYTFSQSIGRQNRPHFKTPLKGLYLASSSTGFGGGVEAVAFAGLKCARDILKN